MAPVGPVVVQNPLTKMKRPPPPGIQTNGVVATTPSPSPSASAKKPPPSAKQPTPNPGVERNITTSTVRPVNRVRRDTITQLGRNSRNSTGLRSSSVVADPQGLDGGPRPYVVTDSYVLKRNAGKRPSLVVHLHPNHFRFDGQDSIFSYVSPMRMFLQHLKTRTIPHDILEYLVQANVPFYDGCLIVRVHDHKSTTKSQDIARPTSSSNAPDPSSVHSRSQYLTPSPYVAFPKEGAVPAEETNPAEAEAIKEEAKEDKEKENSTSATHQDGQRSKAPAKPKVYTLVLHPTSESLQRDLLIKATTPAGGDGRQTAEGTNGVPPSTPMTLVPPTPTAATMPPPAKRQKKVKMELEPNNLAAAEGQILLATEAPLFLEPTKSLEEQIVLLDAMAHPKHSGPPPQPKTRKRTVAEMAADEAAAAEQERYMLLLDERSGTTSTQNAGGTDGDAQNGATAFEPRFERFKVIADIKREHAEKKEQEKIKQQENDRRLQQQRLQQQQEQAQAAQAAQKQQAEAAEKARREAAIRENHARQQSEAQRAAMAARAAAAATPVPPPKQVSTPQNSAPTPHAHPQQNPIAANNMPNGGQVVPQQQPNAVQNAVMAGQAQARFPAQIQQQVVSAQSPIIRQGTPQNHSSPMVNNSVPMQQTSSAMAASPPRPSSVVQNPPMSVPMAHNMSARGSQQSHPSGTPRMPHSTPNMAHGTPISRPAMVATPRMTQASPPPNMMAQNSQMGQMMMMNNQNLAQQNPQFMAQFAAQRAMQQQQQQHLQQQQQHNMQGANLNGNMVAQMSPQQQQHMMQVMQQRQQFLAQQQQQQQQQQMQQQQGGMPTQQQLAQQYSQQLQNMQGNQMRQMTPQMQAQLQMARMQQQQQQAAQQAAQQQMGGNTMQRQVSGQMMNGNNANMQAMLQMQQQQQQAAQQQRQMSQQQQQQTNPLQMQIHQTARNVFARMIQETTAKYGGRDQVPEEVVNQVKAQSIQQAHMIVKNTIAQRQAAQQNQLLMQQQQQAMQGMGGMMGPQGM